MAVAADAKRYRRASRLICCLLLTRSIAGLAKAILDVPQLVKAFFLEAGTRFDIWRVDARESRPKERVDRQSIVEHIATLPCFNAEQELTLYDSAS